jgi:hypothetical protein
VTIFDRPILYIRVKNDSNVNNIGATMASRLPKSKADESYNTHIHQQMGYYRYITGKVEHTVLRLFLLSVSGKDVPLAGEDKFFTGRFLSPASMPTPVP